MKWILIINLIAIQTIVSGQDISYLDSLSKEEIIKLNSSRSELLDHNSKLTGKQKEFLFNEVINSFIYESDSVLSLEKERILVQITSQIDEYIFYQEDWFRNVIINIKPDSIENSNNNLFRMLAYCINSSGYEGPNSRNEEVLELLRKSNYFDSKKFVVSDVCERMNAVDINLDSISSSQYRYYLDCYINYLCSDLDCVDSEQLDGFIYFISYVSVY